LYGGFSPAVVSGESPTYGFVAGNNGASQNAAIQFL
jgi:hypothetical protein